MYVCMYIYIYIYINIYIYIYTHTYGDRAVAFDNVIAVQNGVNVFESRETSVENWRDSFIR